MLEQQCFHTFLAWKCFGKKIALISTDYLFIKIWMVRIQIINSCMQRKETQNLCVFSKKIQIIKCTTCLIITLSENSCCRTQITKKTKDSLHHIGLIQITWLQKVNAREETSPAINFNNKWRRLNKVQNVRLDTKLSLQPSASSVIPYHLQILHND